MMEHTPVKSAGSDNPPSGKLAAVTRKQNEIEEFLKHAPENLEIIRELFTQYLVKVEILFDSCSDKHQEWLTKHKSHIIEFRTKVENLIHPKTMTEKRSDKDTFIDLNDLAESGPSFDFSSVPVQQARVANSVRSTTSSAIARLAEQKAELQASKEAHARERSIKAEELRLKYEHEQRMLQLQEKKEKSEEEKLARKIDIYEEEIARSNASNVSIRSVPPNRNVGTNIDAASFHPRVAENPPNEDIRTQVTFEHAPNSFSPNDFQSTPAATSTFPIHSTPSPSNDVTTKMLKILENQNEISGKIATCQQRSILPQKKIMTFDGSEITQYKLFKLNFERTIANECTTDEDRYLFLQQFTSGKANRIVNTCSHYDATVAYYKAMELLEYEFGNEYKISSAYIQKLNNWPVVKNDDIKGLEELSMFLCEVRHYCECMSVRNQLQSPQEIMNIVLKLPYRMRERWRRKCHDLQMNFREVGFRDLVEYVQLELSVIKQPMFGNINDPTTKKSSAPLQSRTKKILATPTTDSPNKYCYYCKKTDHYISSCNFFEKLKFDKKSEFIRKAGLCYGCLRSRHMSKDCKSRMKCSTCSRMHPTILHDPDRPIPEEAKDPQPSTSADSTVCASRNVPKLIKSSKVIFPYVAAKVRKVSNGEQIATNCALDTCASDCWISEKLVKLLEIKTRPYYQDIGTMDGQNKNARLQVVNNLTIYDYDNNYEVTIPVLFMKPSTVWPFSKNDLMKPDEIAKIGYLDSIPFRFTSDEIDILIGGNIPIMMKPLETSDGPVDAPYASRHLFGWAFNGPIKGRSLNRSICNRISVENDLSIDTYIEKLISHDFVDSDPIEKSQSVNDTKFLQKVQSSIRKLPDKHFEIALPLKKGYVFPSNRNQALKYFLGTKKRLEKNTTLYEDYNKFMETMFEKGFAEIIPREELTTNSNKLWYITHHAVYHKQKKNIRVVFNASLKYENVSLNDNLIAGPDLTGSLLGVLIRFRQEPIAVIADIEKMFYQVKVPKEDADLLRFFWLDHETKTTIECRLLVHLFGANSSPSVAQYALQQTAENSNCDSVKSTILKNFYVDDLLKSYSSSEIASQQLPEVIDALAQGGFRLTAFNSNSPEVLNSLASDPRSSSVALASNEDSSRTLGLIWNIREDTLGYKINISQQDSTTKRQLLKTLASIYDPLGFASPALIEGKKLFQESCKLHLQWDEVVPPEIQDAWNKWIENINMLSSYEVPRCMKISETVDKIELHTFADGSEKAYGCVSYIKFIYDDNRISTSLLASKSRLTPVNNSTLKTVPRIELSAAKLAIEQARKLKSELQFDVSCIFWSDSTTVLSYVKSESLRFHRFVANKIDFIRNFSNPQDWCYIDTKNNPADLISRGCSSKKLIKSNLWNNGPDVLKNKQICNREIEIDENDIELKSTSTTLTVKIESSPLDQLFQSCSSWYRLKTRIAWLLVIRDSLHKKVGLKNKEITLEILASAEIEIIKYLQNKYFMSEINLASNNSNIPKSSPLRKLNPYLDNNSVLRVGGRISRSQVPHDAMHPVILPSCYISELLLQNIHFKVGHLGRETIVATVRQKYHILNVNMLVRKLLRNCLTCRRVNGKPIQQLMADLPETRVTADVAAFHHTGVDLFGPFIVVHGRKTEKKYGVVFTCFSSRAIHLEIADSLSTDSFINALRRFICRRGNVASLTSDNGTNLTSTYRELKIGIQEWNQSQINEHLKQKDIAWHFNPATGSHHGGAFEREIRTVRKTLTSMLNCQNVKLNFDQLHTLLCEVESILNGRPLTRASSDPDDARALTPNDILLFNAGITFPPGLFDKHDDYMNRRYRQVQYLTNVFWKRWKNEYLITLQERQKWNSLKENLKVNDLVLVMDVSTSRNSWPLGLVTEVREDRNGLVRSATVRISKCKDSSTKGFGSSKIVRPIVKLIKLC